MSLIPELITTTVTNGTGCLDLIIRSTDTIQDTLSQLEQSKGPFSAKPRDYWVLIKGTEKLDIDLNRWAYTFAGFTKAQVIELVNKYPTLWALLEDCELGPATINLAMSAIKVY